MQRWCNEAERQEVRHEKHARGREARAKRAATKAATKAAHSQRRAQGLCSVPLDLPVLLWTFSFLFLTISLFGFILVSLLKNSKL
jgi:hypothetical protein